MLMFASLGRSQPEKPETKSGEPIRAGFHVPTTRQRFGRVPERQ